MSDRNHEIALSVMRARPLDWLRHFPVDARDIALINANRIPFVEYGRTSFVRKLYYHEFGNPIFCDLPWTIENNQKCMDFVNCMSADLIGFESPSPNNAVMGLDYILVNVNIATTNEGLDSGLLSTKAENVRIFRGPPDTCPKHPWDAMILRDCTANTANFMARDEISSRKWDVLAMKLCEAYCCPWVVLAVRDSGRASDVPLSR